MLEASDGEQALHIFEADHPQLVIIDWNMPRLTGVDVTKHIRSSEWSRETFVVMLTARDGGEDLLAALDAGVDDYVTKPVMLSHLRARIAIAERRVDQDAARWRAESELAQSRWLAGVGEARDRPPARDQQPARVPHLARVAPSDIDDARA